MKVITVTSGVPDDRPPGFPCFGCGRQCTEEQGVEVVWLDGRRTFELVCSRRRCARRYLTAA